MRATRMVPCASCPPLAGQGGGRRRGGGVLGEGFGCALKLAPVHYAEKPPRTACRQFVHRKVWQRSDGPASKVTRKTGEGDERSLSHVERCVGCVVN